MFDRSDTLSTSAWSIVWQTGKRFRQLCTAREHFSSNKQISIYLVFVVLWYENMSADININMSADINISDKFSSYEELLVFKGNYEKYNLVEFHYSTYFSSLISMSFHYSTYFSSVFSISFHYSTYFSSIFSISFHYSTDSSSISFHYYVSPHFGGETYCFCPVRLSVTQFVSTTPLKLLNRISWNLIGSKDTTCSCAYYQQILIP